MKHLFAHNSDNYVKKGDKVKAYGEYIGAIGNADNQYFSHLHYSVSEGLTEAQLKAYVNGWSFDKVNKHYKEPDVDRDKMFEKPIDNGQAGYDWLQHMGKGFHPGRDYNGFGGGNTDMGYKFKSPVDGEVIFAGDWGSGWGKVIIIEEKQMPVDKTYYIKSELRNELKEIWSKFDHESKSSQEKMAGKLEDYIDELSHALNTCGTVLEDSSKNNAELITENKTLFEQNRTLITAQDKLNDAHDLEFKNLRKKLSTECNTIIETKLKLITTQKEIIATTVNIGSDLGKITELFFSKLFEIIVKKLNINMKK